MFAKRQNLRDIISCHSSKHPFMFGRIPLLFGHTTMNLVLPQGVSFEKRLLDGQWVYDFHHERLGDLGRVVFQGTPNGECNIVCEVAGDPDDPMTATRLAIIKPISLEITAALTAVFGDGDQGQQQSAAQTPAGPTEVVESKLMPCTRCGGHAAMLIFAGDAVTAGDFEDYARKMYHKYSALNLPAWIIGEPLGAPGFETPSRILKIWPHRESIQEVTPKAFNAELDGILARHCR
jgi:hypothetical protein